MPVRNSVLNRTSRYVQGGLTDRYSNRLGWWERDLETFEPQSDDVFVEITPTHDRRPDKLAADYFGRSTFMWIVLQMNNIVDINEEFVAGKTIRLPEPSRATLSFANKRTGGLQVNNTT